MENISSNEKNIFRTKLKKKIVSQRHTIHSSGSSTQNISKTFGNLRLLSSSKTSIKNNDILHSSRNQSKEKSKITLSPLLTEKLMLHNKVKSGVNEIERKYKYNKDGILQFMNSEDKTIIGKHIKRIQLNKPLQQGNPKSARSSKSKKKTIIGKVPYSSNFKEEQPKNKMKTLDNTNHSKYCGNIRSQDKSKPGIVNNSTMNRIIINGYGLNKDTSKSALKYSKQFYELTNQYFDGLKQYQIKKEQLNEENFNKLKNMKTSNLVLPGSQVDIDEEKGKKIIIKSILADNKMESKEFDIFMKLNKKQEKVKIKKQSETFANGILNIDSKEYTNGNNLKNRSNEVNYDNGHRKLRLQNIIKSGEDQEREGVIVGNGNTFKKEKNENERKLIIALKELGPPKFVKPKLRSNTFHKFKSVSGNFFGVPV